MNNIPSSATNPITNMKLPLANSVPSLMDIDPFSQFEFHFPADEPWWDEFDTSDYNSDFSCDSLCSSESDFELEPYEDLDTSFNSMFYHISHTPAPNSETIPTEKENDLVANLISTISDASPNNVYKRRKLSMKRKRQRKKRKKLMAADIEPELRTLWRNVDIVGVLPAKDPTLPPLPLSSLPSVNLASINKQMLRRLPDVIQIPVHSCSNDPTFYERNLPASYDSFVSAFAKTNPFGALPAIRTNLGPVPPPEDACYGYVWTEDGWRVKAEQPPGHVPDRGGGQRRRGEVGGGHVRGADRRGGGWRKKSFM